MGKPKIVGIGELLWDVLPAGRRLGGAPVNFAFYAQEQGAEACIVSAVGQDASGDELLGGIAALGLGVRAVQRNAHPTSTVEVTLDAAGVPAYRIREQVAWDYIERTAEADAAVAGAAVVCWGSLAQRNAVSRRTILALVDAAPVGCLRLFDINLRLNYYDERIVRDSLERADILKLNEDELPVVARFFGLEGAAERVVAQLVERFSLRYVVFTEGGRGSRVTAADGRTSYLATPRVEVADTVGAGDAFTATFAASLMQGLPMEECHRAAVRIHENRNYEPLTNRSMNFISIFRRLFLPLVVLLLAATADAQSAYDEIKADIDKAGGVYFMYPFDTPSATPAPKGYEPFYISHYGRHGARYILSNDQYDNVAEVLRRARADGKLTARGIDACDRFLAIYPHLKGRAGDLTPKGQMQHRRLAGRMYAAYPEIFRRHPRIEAYSTVVPRCIMSMAAFCEGLKEADPSLEIFTETSSVNMYYLNPHSTGNPAGTAEDFRYKSADAPWRPEWRRFCEERIDVETILARLFTDTAYARSICDPLKFEQDLFSVAAHMQCTDLDESFYDLFTFDELCRFWECDNYTYYVEKGPDPRNRGRGTALAETLLDDIVSRAGEDMAAGEPSVRLRFGHDGCIMALLTLMRIDGWTTPVTDPAKIKDVWQVHRIPMASNMQFVFYRNKKNPDDVLVRVLLNEKELRLPLPGDRAPYYRWEDFRDFYAGIVREARLKLEATK